MSKAAARLVLSENAHVQLSPGRDVGDGGYDGGPPRVVLSGTAVVAVVAVVVVSPTAVVASTCVPTFVSVVSISS